MAREAEYLHDPVAPAANSLHPAVFAVVRDQTGRVLLSRRADTPNWELPGGKIELGESAPQAAVREVAEETGVAIPVTGLSGVYTDPGHVMVYATSEVRQQFALCVHAVPVSGEPRPDLVEMINVAWIAIEDLTAIPVQPSMRLRIHDALEHSDRLRLI